MLILDRVSRLAVGSIRGRSRLGTVVGTSRPVDGQPSSCCTSVGTLRELVEGPVLAGSMGVEVRQEVRLVQEVLVVPVVLLVLLVLVVVRLGALVDI